MPFLLLLCFNCGHSMKSFIAPSWNWKDLVLEQQLQCNHFKSSEQINFVSWRKRLHYFCDHLQNRQSAGQTQGMGQLTPTWQVHVKVVIAWGKAGYFESKPSQFIIWLPDQGTWAPRYLQPMWHCDAPMHQATHLLENAALHQSAPEIWNLKLDNFHWPNLQTVLAFTDFVLNILHRKGCVRMSLLIPDYKTNNWFKRFFWSYLLPLSSTARVSSPCEIFPESRSGLAPVLGLDLEFATLTGAWDKKGILTGFSL